MQKYLCPVCGWFGLRDPPYDSTGSPSYEICCCCGFEFGFDDGSNGETYSSYRDKWVESGMPWFDPDTMPPNWNATAQLSRVVAKD